MYYKELSSPSFGVTRRVRKDVSLVAAVANPSASEGIDLIFIPAGLSVREAVKHVSKHNTGRILDILQQTKDMQLTSVVAVSRTKKRKHWQ